MSRYAYVRMSVTLLENLLPPGVTIDCCADKIGPVDNRWLHDKLDLPTNCKISRISAAFLFPFSQVAIALECEDFREVPEACPMPEVFAHYHRGGDFPCWSFCCWTGQAALREDYKKPQCSVCEMERTRKLGLPKVSFFGTYPELRTTPAVEGQKAGKPEESVGIRFREFL